MPTLTFQTQTNRYGEVKIQLLEVSQEELKLETKGWLWAKLNLVYQLQEKIGPPKWASQISLFLHGVRLLSKASDKLPLVNVSEADVTTVHILRLLPILEELLRTSEHPEPQQKRIFSGFKSVVTRLFERFPERNVHVQHFTRYKSQLPRSARTPRKLISDLQASPSGSRPPLGATPFDTVRQLREEVAMTLRNDLQRIKEAANHELDLYRQEREYLAGLKGRKIDLDVKFWIKKFKSESLYEGKRGGDGEYFFGLVKEDPERILSLYVKIAETTSAPSEKNGFRYAGIDNVVSRILELRGIPEIRSRHYVCLPFRACSREMFSALLIVQASTGWNVSSILQMIFDDLEDMVKKGDQPYFINGFKTKIDDETPKFLVEPHMHELRYALELVKWNHEQLKKMGFLRKNEKRLWFGWSQHNKPHRNLMMGHQRWLSEFCEKYSLPHFSYDQLRTQVLAATYSSTGSHELTRHIAGHRSLYSTAKYLDQLLLERTNSAINVEFAKRLEDNITYLFEASPENDGTNVPVGDGTSCINPNNPPVTSFLDGEQCDGRSCHLGKGCSNRRIILNTERLIELIRKRLYFRKNWRRLHAENPHAFEKYIFPNFIFIERLCRFVEAGPYQILFRKIMQEVEGDE